MLTVSQKGDGVRVTDDANKTVRVRADDWTRREAVGVSVAHALAGSQIGPDDPEVVVSASASRLRFPAVYAAAVPLAGGDRTRFGGNVTHEELPPGEYLLRIETNVRVFCRVDGAITLERDRGESLRVSFPEPTALELAFASHVSRPDATVTVPRTPAGVATGLATLPSANEVVSPDRTWPTMRDRPPLLEFGEELSVPQSVRESAVDTGIEVVVPPELSALVPVASLVQYLSADVSIEAGTEPLVDLDGHTHRLGRAELSHAAARLLERTFYLDCVARGAGPHGGTLSVADTFDTLGLDADRLYDAPMAERVRTYLAADYRSVADRFPEWHLSMHIEPTYEHARTLPYLVGSLPFIFRPEGEPLSEREWLEKSLTGGGFGPPDQRSGSELLRGADASDGSQASSAGATAGSQSDSKASDRSGPVRGSSDRPTEVTGPRNVRGFGRRTAANVDLLDPELGPGRVHGWLAEGTPIDGFKALPAAYRHRDDVLDDPGTGLSVTAVVNEVNRTMVSNCEMSDEHEAAVEHYRTRADELTVDLTVERQVRTGDLARIFESSNDLVHFVGHHEDAGLECPDGFLSPSSIDRSGAQTFFLNACGSYPFGETLVRKGSVAGGATLSPVNDSNAARVGTTFARLLVQGYCMGRALAKAARHTIAPRDYLVVGDATFRASQSNDLAPPDVWIAPDGEDGFQVLKKTPSPWGIGGEQMSSSAGDESSHWLLGNSELLDFSHESLLDFLEMKSHPVIFRDEFYWPDELLRELSVE